MTSALQTSAATAAATHSSARSRPCSISWLLRAEVHPGLCQLARVLAHPLCADDGRYQYRLRGAAEEPINSKSKGSTVLGLPPEHPTLPSLLKGQRLPHGADRQVAPGLPAHFSPIKSGYEEFFGPMSGGVDYFTHASNNGTHDLYGNEEEKARRRLPDRPALATRGRLRHPHGAGRDHDARPSF
jgi:hypothetical protein